MEDNNQLNKGIAERLQLANQKEELEKVNFMDTIKEFLYKYYVPVTDPRNATLHFTTEDIYRQLVELYPSSDLTQEQIAIWMNAGGFTFYDFGEMKFEWLLKKA